MTVYVDDMEASFTPGHRPGYRYLMSHMIADTDSELHKMADRIGVARKWFQGDHYDITQSKRRLAVGYGAVEITWREAGAMMFLKRCGKPMGAPEDALDRAMGQRRKGK